MAVNKVIYVNETLIDLTSDTIIPSKLFSGYTAHDQTGEKIVGTYVEPTPPSGSLEITESGTYDVAKYEQVVVNVASNEPIEIPVTSGKVAITETGVYVVTAYYSSNYITILMNIYDLTLNFKTYFMQSLSLEYSNSTQKIGVPSSQSGNYTIKKCYQLMKL